MLAQFDFDVIARSWRYVLGTGLLLTVQLTVLALAGGLALGTLLALARLSGIKLLALAAAAYVNLMRSVPLVLVIFWFYFLVPYVGAWMMGAAEPLRIGAFWSALLSLLLFEAAYFCEIMRGGIQAVPRGQLLAAQALGMAYWPSMGQVILPQAVRAMLPLLLTQTIVLFQDVSLVYVLALPDFLGAASKVARRDGRLVEMYLFVALVYFILCFALSALARRWQRRGRPPA